MAGSMENVCGQPRLVGFRLRSLNRYIQAVLMPRLGEHLVPLLSSSQISVSPAQYSLTSEESWPKAPIISFHFLSFND